MNRQKQEYNYLKLSLRKAPNQIQIQDTESTMEMFMRFREAFVEQMESFNASPETATPAPSQVEPTHRPIKKRKDFYKTFVANAFTLVMVAFSLVLIGYVVMNLGDVRICFASLPSSFRAHCTWCIACSGCVVNDL